MRAYELYEDALDSKLAKVEEIADKLFAKYGIDIEFTKHFKDRMRDSRNGKPISPREILGLLRKIYYKHGKDIANQKPDFEAVMTDLTNDVNVPFLLDLDVENQHMDLITKTSMRKPDFKTPDPQFKVEAAGVGRIVQGVNTTPDVGPGEIKKQAAKFGNTVDRDGRPPIITGKETAINEEQSWQEGEYTFEYTPEDNDGGSISVFHSEEFAGEFYWARSVDHGNQYIGSVEIEPHHRRRGLATRLYNYAEEMTGEKIIPDPDNSDDAKAFWRSRNQ